MYDRYLLSEIQSNKLEIIHYRQNLRAHRFITTGPFQPYSSESEMFEELATIWENSSVQMHRLCKANEIEYFHFLQPNQYVSGSKKMSSNEAKVTLLESSDYGKASRIGYPYLLKSADKLVKKGVNFHDLTMIFEDIAGPIYRDNCCHCNQRGNEILGSAIGKIVLNSLHCR